MEKWNKNMTEICQHVKLIKTIRSKGIYVSQWEKGSPNYEEVIYNVLAT